MTTLTTGQARELLAEHLGRAEATDPFAIRALAVVHRPGTRAARLDALDLGLLVTRRRSGGPGNATLLNSPPSTQSSRQAASPGHRAVDERRCRGRRSRSGNRCRHTATLDLDPATDLTRDGRKQCSAEPDVGDRVRLVSRSPAAGDADQLHQVDVGHQRRTHVSAAAPGVDEGCRRGMAVIALKLALH
jgi:hypothetical protein